MFSLEGEATSGLFLRVEYNRNSRFNFVGKDPIAMRIVAGKLSVTPSSKLFCDLWFRALFLELPKKEGPAFHMLIPYLLRFRVLRIALVLETEFCAPVKHRVEM